MGYDLTEIIVEDESGALIEKREKLQWILDNLETGEFEGVVVNKLDRLARNLKELLIMHDDMFLPAGIAMISVKDKFDTSTASGRLFFQILGGFAEFERSLITERTMDGITNKAKKGEHASGSIPTGYKSIIVDGKKKMVVDEEESALVQLIFNLRDKLHYSFYQIADHLNDKGIKPKRSKSGKWRNTSVKYIYDNPKYKGLYTFNRGDDCIAVENELLRIVDC
jgi:site-specific DNA recombinase